MNKHNHEYYMNQLRRNAQNGMLPPLIAGQGVNQKMVPNINNHQGYNPSYHAGYRPSKLRSLNNKPGIATGH